MFNITKQRFISLGYYNTAQDVSGIVGNSEIVTGDAMDDITDIVSDLEG